MRRARFRIIAGGPPLRILIADAFATTVLGPTANAQRVVNAQLRAFTHTSLNAGLINRGLAVLPPVVFHKPPTLRSAGSQVIDPPPPIFAQDGYPTNGEWKKRFPVTGCRNETILKFYFTTDTQEKVDTTMGIPGEMRADIRLHRHVRPYALIGATLLARSCQQFDIINSAFNGVDVPGKVDPTTQRPFPPPWSETLTLRGCGRQRKFWSGCSYASLTAAQQTTRRLRRPYALS